MNTLLLILAVIALLVIVHKFDKVIYSLGHGIIYGLTAFSVAVFILGVIFSIYGWALWIISGVIALVVAAGTYVVKSDEYDSPGPIVDYGLGSLSEADAAYVPAVFSFGNEPGYSEKDWEEYVRRTNGADIYSVGFFNAKNEFMKNGPTGVDDMIDRHHRPLW